MGVHRREIGSVKLPNKILLFDPFRSAIKNKPLFKWLPSQLGGGSQTAYVSFDQVV